MRTRINSILSFIRNYPGSLLWVVLILLTRPYYYADSNLYVLSIIDHIEGRFSPFFWEATHVLWRPLGELTYIVIHNIIGGFIWNRSRIEVNLSLLIVVLLSTFAGIIFFYRFLRILPLSKLCVNIGVVFYVVSDCILNYCQTGTSYEIGISMLIIGIYYAAVPSNPHRTIDQILSAFFLSLAPLLWLPYVLAIPAAIIAPVLIFGWNSKNIKKSVIQGLLYVAFSLFILAPIFLHLHLFSVTSLSTWALHRWGAASNVGPTRTFFGLPKSLFYLGNDAIYVKRFLYHDPLNPVSLPKLLSLGLWKIGIFYIMLGTSIFLVIRRSDLRKYLLFIAIGFIPVLILSVRWDGASLERHMPLFPFLFLLFALGFEASSRSVKWLFGMVAISALLVNVSAMWYATNESREEAIAARLHEIWPRVNSKCSIALLSSHDDYADFQSVHPFDTFNQSDRLQFFSTVSIGEDSAVQWKKRFETNAEYTWQNGGDVWVSRLLLSKKPGDSVYWVENYQPQVKWNDISNYFRNLRFSDSTRSFLLLARNSIATP